MKKANSLYIILQIALWGIYGVLYSYANRYLLDKGMTSTAIGILLAFATAVAFFAQPFITSLIDKRKLTLSSTLIILSALMGICSVLLLLSQNIIFTAVIYFVTYIGVVVYPAFINSMGVVADKSGFRVNFSLARGVGAFAFGVTAQVTNIIIKEFGIISVPVFALLFSSAGILATVFFPKGAERLTQKEKASGIAEFFKRNKRFMLTLISVSLLNIGHNILGNCMYQIAVHKGNGNMQGTVLLISTVIEIPTIVLFTKLLKIKGSGFWLRLSGIFFTLRIVLTLILPGIEGLIIAQSCQILGYALYTVSSVYYAGEVVSDKDTVKGQAYVSSANTIGCLIAHLTGGAMIDAVGTDIMLMITTAVSVIGMVMLFFTTENTNKLNKI